MYMMLVYRLILSYKGDMAIQLCTVYPNVYILRFVLFIFFDFCFSFYFSF